MTTHRDVAQRVLPDLLSSFALLSRLPVPAHRPTGAASAWAWPLVGAAVGFWAAVVAGMALWLGLTPGVVAVLVLATLALLTGAMHEDGLSDTADGFFGGWTQARRLEIMRDSRVGTYGVLALLLVTLARWSALTVLLTHGGYFAALMAAGALSRVPMGLIMALLPNARGEGLSHAMGQPAPPVAMAGLGMGLVVALLVAGWIALPLALAALVVGILLSASALRRIGGQTGDVLGAAQQLAEVACLAILAAWAE